MADRSGFSSAAETASGMGLRSPQQLGLDFAPARVRAHGLRDAHTCPLVAPRKGESFRVPASQAWGYPSLELRAGNSWPLMGFDCDVPETVLDALYANHLGRPRPESPRLPQPNMIVQSLVARIGMETEFPLSPSGSVRRCVRTQAVRARSLCSGLFGRVGSP